MTNRVRVSFVEFEIPAHLEGVSPSYDPADCRDVAAPAGCPTCQSGCPDDTQAPPQARPPKPPQCSDLPVRYADRSIALQAVDLASSGYGEEWGHTRSYASRLSENDNPGNGVNWQVKEWAYLVFPDASTVVVMGMAQGALWFDRVGANYTPRFSVRQSLFFDADRQVYQLVDVSGAISEFASPSGVFLRRTTPGGTTIEVTEFAPNGFNFVTVERTVTVAGVTIIEQYLYDYVDVTQPYPLLASVTLRRKVGGGDWTNVNRAAYDYYGSSDSRMRRASPGDFGRHDSDVQRCSHGVEQFCYSYVARRNGVRLCGDTI